MLNPTDKSLGYFLSPCRADGTPLVPCRSDLLRGSDSGLRSYLGCLLSLAGTTVAVVSRLVFATNSNAEEANKIGLRCRLNQCQIPWANFRAMCGGYWGRAVCSKKRVRSATFSSRPLKLFGLMR